MSVNEDKLDLASFNEVCEAFLSIGNLQKYAANIGSSMGKVDFSNVPNVSGDEVGACSKCLNSTCGVNGSASGLQPIYDNLYKTVNLLYKAEAEAFGMFGGDAPTDLDFSALLEETMSESSSFGDDVFSSVFEKALTKSGGVHLKSFALGIDGEFGATQGDPFNILIQYLDYLHRSDEKEENPNESAPFNPNAPHKPGRPSNSDYDIPEYIIEQGKYIYDLLVEHGITDENTMLKALHMQNMQGCGYSVITNWICDEYADNPEAFEEKYGYPLYIAIDDENGDEHESFNYAVLSVDAFLENNSDLLNDCSPNLDVSIHPDEMAAEYSAIGGDHEFDVTTRDISVETYQEHMDEGYTGACIAAYRFELKPYGSNTETENYVANQESEDGHWMTITGVSENGNFIVSSWGQEWELLSSDVYATFPVDGVQNENRDDACLVFIK